MDQRLRIAKGIHLYRRPNSPHWWAEVSVGGTRARCSTGTSDRKEAARFAIKLAASERPHSTTAVTFYNVLAAWLVEKPRGRTDIYAVKKLRSLYPDRPVAQVDGATISTALQSLGPEHYNRLVNVARAALRLAHARGQVAAVPAIPRKKEKPARVRFLSSDEMQRLLAALPDHLRPPVEFSLYTGLRQSNVLRMQWEWVDLDAGLLHVPAAEYKTGRPHTVVLGQRAVALLRSLVNPQSRVGPVFLFRGKPIGSPKTAWGNAVRKAGITDLRWHDLRHTWASYMAMSGAPLHAIKEAGGWATMDMVARYSHLTNEAVRVWQDAAATKVMKRG